MAHDHPHDATGRAFAIGIVLNVAFIVAEVVYGLTSGSLALLSDAGHNLSDVAGLVLAWLATRIAMRHPTARHTYGFGRASILSALANALMLFAASGAIVFEAVHRFSKPEPINGITLIVVAGIGIAVNGGSALLFMKGGERDLNVRGAFLHLAADALVSLGVVIAGVVIRFTGWSWLDPLTSILLSVVICASTWSLLRSSLRLVMDAVPDGLEAEAVRARLSDEPGVVAVEHLHIWAMSTTKTALTVVLRVDDWPSPLLLPNLKNVLAKEFNIEHATIELNRVADGPH